MKSVDEGFFIRNSFFSLTMASAKRLRFFPAPSSNSSPSESLSSASPTPMEEQSAPPQQQDPCKGCGEKFFHLSNTLGVCVICDSGDEEITRSFDKKVSENLFRLRNIRIEIQRLRVILSQNPLYFCILDRDFSYVHRVQKELQDKISSFNMFLFMRMNSQMIPTITNPLCLMKMKLLLAIERSLVYSPCEYLPKN